VTLPPLEPEVALAPPRRSLASRILAFAGVPFIALLAPLIFLPVLARLAGTDVWVAIAIGQSVGGFAAVVAGLGYATLAPPQVAMASAFQRERILATSVHVRLPIWGIAALIAVVISLLVAPEASRLEAGAMALAMSLAALAPTWYWIGVGRALPILWSEVLPRTLATLVATGILVAGGGAIWYPVLLAVAMLAGPAAVYVREAGAQLLRVDRPEVREVLRSHPPAVVAESAAGAYNALAVTIVASVTPLGQAARFVSGEKAYRIGQYSVSALGNALQGWVVEDRKELIGQRLRTAISLHVGLGLAGLAGFGFLGQWLTVVLFGAGVAINSATAWGFGVAILGIALGTAFGRIGLITIGARKAFMACVLVASVVGAASLAIAGATWGAQGAAWALGLTELLSGTAQGIVLAVLWRRRAAIKPE
jgi:O-antigen/teichoic acid export membrane protein